MSLTVALLLILFCHTEPQAVKIDLSPLKEPLDKAAASFDRAVKLAENARAEVIQTLNWVGMAVASLVTALAVNLYHTRQLYQQKEDRRS